jgi:hypothetical protein
MIVVLIGIGRSLVKGFVKEIIVMREPVNAHMIGLVIVILEMKSTTIEIGTGLGTGSEERTGKEITVVTVIAIAVTKIGTGTVVVTMIERRIVIALMIAIMRGAGNAREVMNETVATYMRGILTMLLVDPNMTKVCQISDKIMDMACMSNTKVMSPMDMVKMDVDVKMSTQRGMSMSTIVWTRTVRWNPIIRFILKMLNLMALRKVRHLRKVTTSITRQLNA